METNETTPDPKEPKTTLTKRELQVVLCMANGYQNKEIGKILNISEHTAKFHVNSVVTKTKQSTRLGAVIVCLKAGIIKLDQLMLFTPKLSVEPKPTEENKE